LFSVEQYEMGINKPRVSIGLPVFNGEKYLAEALDSILAQTYANFELIISDNASTDSTEEICQAYAARDQRIHYVRNEKNLGASENFNRVFKLSSGVYFKWATHDDSCASTFLERCVEVLDRDPSVVLCYTRAQVIDEHGVVLLDYDAKPGVSSPEPRERFYECICVRHPQITIVPVMVFGLIRASTLKKTRLIGNYTSSDGVLLGELALRGRFYEVPEFLFSYRRHREQSCMAYGRYRVGAWYDPRKAGKITFPHWRLLIEHFNSVGRVLRSWYERVRCYVYLFWWARMTWKGLAKDLIWGPLEKLSPDSLMAIQRLKRRLDAVGWFSAS
jgi:glycosyltransferase involved in cell wall biosynthesis